MKHLVLVGDSIFDNAGYVAAGAAVIDQLQDKLPQGYRASLLAVDGDVTDDVYAQLENIPSDATHLFLSVGGNDALRIASVMYEKVNSVGEAMEIFTEIKSDFQNRYRKLLGELAERHVQLTICTVHDSVPELEQRSLTALALYNEVILKEAFAIGAPVIDLRLICNESTDYSEISPIEPSQKGGNKIVSRIIEIVNNDNCSTRPEIYL